MNITQNLLMLTILGVGVAGCWNVDSRQAGGTVIGAGTGALLGAQIGAGTGQLVAVGVGAVLGAFAGSEIARSIQTSDHTYADRNAYYSLDTGRYSRWSNPSTGHSGDIRVGPKYLKDNIFYRDFTQTIYINGKATTAHGKAYRKSDGTWHIYQD